MTAPKTWRVFSAFFRKFRPAEDVGYGLVGLWLHLMLDPGAMRPVAERHVHGPHDVRGPKECCVP